MSSPSPTPSDAHAPSTGWTVVLSGVLVAAVVTTVLVGLDLAVRPPLPARIQADDVTGMISLLGDLVARLAGVGTLGVLVAVVAFTPTEAGHRLEATGRRRLLWAGRLGQVWAAASLLNTFANPAYVNGVGIHTTFTPGSWWTFLWASPSALAWLVSALVAAAIVLVCYLGRHAAGPLVGLVAGVLSWTFVAATGNVTVGLDHDWATDAVLAASLAMYPLAATAIGVLVASRDAAARAYQRLVPVAILVALGGQLVVAWQQLAGVSPLATPYGLWTLALGGVLVLWGLSFLVRLLTGSTARSVARDVALAIAWLTCLTAENHVPPPRFLEPQTIMVNYLGYEVAVAPTVARLVSLGRPNLLWVLIVVAALAAYTIAFVRARRRGRAWPIGRLVAWFAAWLLTLFLAVTGLWEYSTVQYSWHMVVHMTVNMLVPVLAVLGAPFGLARAASGPRDAGDPVRTILDGLEDHRLWQLLTSPPVAWLAYVGSLFAVYFTPAFSWLMKYHWAHQLMLLFFMATGYFFFTLIIGTDHGAARLPHLLKLALVISIMPFHAMFAVGILSSRTLIGQEFYEAIAVPWLGDHAALLADQGIAGQAAWFLGEVPLLVVIVALAAQWFRQDSREASDIDARADSGEDDSFDAYNDMLAELAKRDAQLARSATLKRFES